MKLKVNAPLDPGFMPMSVVYRDFEAAVKAEGGEKLTIGLERNDGLTSVFTIEVFKDGTGHDEENHEFVERLVKTLLWARGGYKVIIAGSAVIAEAIKADYAEDGISYTFSIFPDTLGRSSAESSAQAASIAPPVTAKSRKNSAA